MLSGWYHLTCMDFGNEAIGEGRIQRCLRTARDTEYLPASRQSCVPAWCWFCKQMGSWEGCAHPFTPTREVLGQFLLSPFHSRCIQEITITRAQNISCHAEAAASHCPCCASYSLVWWRHSLQVEVFFFFSPFYWNCPESVSPFTQPHALSASLWADRAYPCWHAVVTQDAYFFGTQHCSALITAAKLSPGNYPCKVITVCES